MELSIIIPAYNEGQRIKTTLEHTINWLERRKINYEIIVVDDGSSDNTREVVSTFKKVRLTNARKNRGKGYSVKQGMLLADKELVLFMDADNSTKIDEVEHFIPYLNQYEVVIGSRNLPDSTIALKQPLLRSLLGKIFPFFVRLLVIRGIKDTQCGFKLFKRPVVQKLCRLQNLDRFAFDVELLFLAKKFGYGIKEVPITWYNDEGSTVGMFTPLRMLVSLFKIRLQNLHGGYNEEHLG